MEVIILKDSNEVAEEAAFYVCQTISNNPKAVLGLATGSTPLKMYKSLVKKYENKEVDFSQVSSFNLDEYVGLEKNHPASYFSYMNENLFSKINIPEGQNFIPDGVCEDVPSECRAYEEAIEGKGGIDLQILGIGRDGHIGFNEPSSSLNSRTRLKTLTAQTRKDNALHFSNVDEVPHHVLTMGVGTIMQARHIILLAFGENKAEAIAQCVEGPITAMVPASVLQYHPKVTLLIDESAAQKLKRHEYYRWVYEQKPQWQKHL